VKKAFPLTVTLLGCLLLASPSWAQTSPTAPPPSNPPSIVQGSSGQGPSSNGNQGISVWGFIPWAHGFGAGVRYMMPLAIDPVLRNTTVRDSWGLEFGADIMHWDCGYGTNDCGWTQLVPVVGMMWLLGITEQFIVYPKVELGWEFGWYSGPSFAARQSYGGLFAAGAAGVMFKLTNGLTLRGELGSYGLKAGVGWLF
jgi:hypothetical protein